MESAGLASFLRGVRKNRNLTLATLADATGGTLSKQVLSLIETGKMPLPPNRVDTVKKAYRLNAEEIETLNSLLKDDKLPAVTSDEYVVARVLGETVNWAEPAQLYIIGGKRLAFKSEYLQEMAASFLQKGQKNEICFFYPRRSEELQKLPGGPALRTGIWERNVRDDIWNVGQDIVWAAQKSAKGHHQKIDIWERLKFFRVNEEFTSDLSVALAFSLCHPLTVITICNSKMDQSPIGYMYAKGDEYDRAGRYIPLSRRYAKQILDLVASLRDLARQNSKLVTEEHHGT